MLPIGAVDPGVGSLLVQILASGEGLVLKEVESPSSRCFETNFGVSRRYLEKLTFDTVLCLPCEIPD